MTTFFVFASAIGLLGCGGKVLVEATPAPDGAKAAAGPIAIDPDPDPSAGGASASEIPPDGSWGLWQLSSIAEPGGRDYAPPFQELDLHPDGIAYRWICLAASTGNGLPCPPPMRVGCVTGTAKVMGVAWHVALTDADGRALGAGDVTEDPSGDIAIDGSGILPAAARWHRVAAPTRERCFP